MSLKPKKSKTTKRRHEKKRDWTKGKKLQRFVMTGQGNGHWEDIKTDNPEQSFKGWTAKLPGGAFRVVDGRGAVLQEQSSFLSETVGNTKYREIKELVKDLSVPNLIRVSEGEEPLDFGRGEYTESFRIALAGIDDDSIAQEVAENVLAMRRMREQQDDSPIRDPITVVKGGIDGMVFVFKGDVRKGLKMSNRMNIKAYDEKTDNYKESEMLMQSDYDQESLMDYMGVIQCEDFMGGYPTIMENPGYF
jgi:hypothetical protein